MQMDTRKYLVEHNKKNIISIRSCRMELTCGNFDKINKVWWRVDDKIVKLGGESIDKTTNDVNNQLHPFRWRITDENTNFGRESMKNE